MRDLAENIAILDAIRAQSIAVGEVNARANGAHDSAGEIDLADYGYPRKILVCVSVGEVAAGGLLDIDIESGDESAALTETDHSFDQIDAIGDVVYEYTPTRRFINIEATVTVDAISASVTLVMEHCRFGNRGSDA
jgi:hypothetical protein